MYHIIINPASRSGHGKRIWKEVVKPTLNEQNVPYQAYFSEKAGDVAKLARNIAFEHAPKSDVDGEYCKIIVLGGDGTVNETLQGIPVGAKVEIGYIPTGSSNDLARDLGISKDPLKALDTILTAHEHPETSIVKMDRGIVKAGEKNLSFAVSCGLGFDAAVCAEANNSKIKKTLNKLKLGKLTYLGIALKQLFAAKKVACDLYLDDAEPIHIKKYLFAASMIHRYEGGGFNFCPTADYTDGTFDLCVVGNLPKLVILLALPTAFFGKHYWFPGVNHYRAKKVRVETSSLLWMHTDGEAHKKCNSLEISCIQEDIRFIR